MKIIVMTIALFLSLGCASNIPVVESPKRSITAEAVKEVKSKKFKLVKIFEASACPNTDCAPYGFFVPDDFDPFQVSSEIRFVYYDEFDVLKSIGLSNKDPRDATIEEFTKARDLLNERKFNNTFKLARSHFVNYFHLHTYLDQTYMYVELMDFSVSRKFEFTNDGKNTESGAFVCLRGYGPSIEEKDKGKISAKSMCWQVQEA